MRVADDPAGHLGRAGGIGGEGGAGRHEFGGDDEAAGGDQAPQEAAAADILDGGVDGVMSRSCGGRLDGGGDALIAAAAADVAAHRAVDLVLGRVLVGREQRGGLHDLAGLAIAALRDIEGAPRLLHRVVAVAGRGPRSWSPSGRRHR